MTENQSPGGKPRRAWVQSLFLKRWALSASRFSAQSLCLNRAHCLSLEWEIRGKRLWVRHLFVSKGIFLMVSEKYKKQEFEGRWWGQGQSKGYRMRVRCLGLLTACHPQTVSSKLEPWSHRETNSREELSLWGGFLRPKEVLWGNWSSSSLHVEDSCLKWLPLHRTERGFYCVEFLRYNNWSANGIKLKSLFNLNNLMILLQ